VEQYGENIVMFLNTLEAFKSNYLELFNSIFGLLVSKVNYSSIKPKITPILLFGTESLMFILVE
jgi:hypothetical protein